MLGKLKQPISHLLHTALLQQPQSAGQLAPSRCISGVPNHEHGKQHGPSQLRPGRCQGHP